MLDKLKNTNSKVDSSLLEEIGLFDFFETLWNDKFKILSTTLAGFLIGIFISTSKPNSFEVFIPIKTLNQSNFIEYINLNEFMNRNGFSYSINEKSIFEFFVNEFNNYEEINDAVSSSEFTLKAIENLDDDSKKKAKDVLAKSFKLKAPSNNEENWIIYFVWHDALEGMRLINDATQRMILNMRDKTLADIDKFVTTIENRNALTLEELQFELSLIEENQLNLENQLIQNLIEQITIAKELDIEQSNLYPYPNLLEPNIFNSPQLYLRGYKSLEQELLLIQNRTDEERLLKADGYLEIKNKIFSLKNNFLSKQLIELSKIIVSKNPYELIKLDFSDVNIKPLKISIKYVALSMGLGGMAVGFIFVFISNAYRNRKKNLLKA